MQNFQSIIFIRIRIYELDEYMNSIIFIWIRIYKDFFKSALAHL